MQIAVIGGGAAGLVAAISAKSKYNEVVIYEKNNVCGKKILVTGNGKCNYFNEDFTINHYHSTNIDILDSIISLENKNKVLDFFKMIGIESQNINGYFYPFSNQAITIKEALVKEALIRGVKIVNDIEIVDIDYHNNFEIITNKGRYCADKVVLATGSKAMPKTGSTGDGYKLAKKFGHHVIKPLPALVQLQGEGNYFKDWANIRTYVEVSLFENDNFKRSEMGEIQLTDYGVSGICIFQLSSQIVRGLEYGNKECITINFVPYIDDIFEYLGSRSKGLTNRTISEFLDGMLNYKLVNTILKVNKIDRNVTYDELSKKDKLALCNSLTKFKFKVIGYNDFERAQVCSGGISLDDINIKTMESNYQPGLYIIGELLDVDGDCGGYNLGFAWLSGMISGEHIKEIYDKNKTSKG